MTHSSDSSQEAEMAEFQSLVNTPPTYGGSSIKQLGGDTAESRPDHNVVKNPSMWASQGTGRYVACEKTYKQLPPGQYTINASNHGLYFQETKVVLDDLMTLPDSASADVMNQIEVFWQKEEHFRKYQYAWKRGVLLWGPPGSGKTSTVQMIVHSLIEKGGIAVYCDCPELAAGGLRLLRSVEPSRPIVMILEDIDAIINRYGESGLLALMDGELQVDNVVFLASTNYPERLDKRFINRPSRFDIVRKIGMPTDDARKYYISKKVPDLSEEQLAKWVLLSKDFSMAHVKEMIVSVKVFEVELEAAATRLRGMCERRVSSEDDGRKVGF